MAAMNIDPAVGGKMLVSDLDDSSPGSPAFSDTPTVSGISPITDLSLGMAPGDASATSWLGDDDGSASSVDSAIVVDATSPGTHGGAGFAGLSSPLASTSSHQDGLSTSPLTLSFLPQPGNSDSATGRPSATASAPTGTVLYSDDSGSAAPHSGSPTIDLLSRGSSGGGGPGGSGGARLTPYSAQNDVGMKFVINWDSSVSNAPSGFQSSFEKAVDYFLNTFASPITITLNVGWGEVAGSRLSSFALGESETYLDQVSSYSALYGALSNEATTGSTDQKTAVGSLPSSSPINNANYWVSTAEAKALGLTTNNTALDGYVGFGSTVSWYFDSGIGSPGSGQYDFFGVAEHEISEVMGRIALLGGTVGSTANSYSELDLFRYSGAGSRSLVGGQTAYLSFDGGSTALNSFNTTSGGDWGDWQSSGPNAAPTDAYNAFASSGIKYAASANDTRALNVLGYTLHV